MTQVSPLVLRILRGRVAQDVLHRDADAVQIPETIEDAARFGTEFFVAKMVGLARCYVL